jgi:hypothetical protein
MRCPDGHDSGRDNDDERAQHRDPRAGAARGLHVAVGERSRRRIVVCVGSYRRVGEERLLLLDELVELLGAPPQHGIGSGSRNTTIDPLSDATTQTGHQSRPARARCPERPGFEVLDGSSPRSLVKRATGALAGAPDVRAANPRSSER